jgi:hypothetical protein
MKAEMRFLLLLAIVALPLGSISAKRTSKLIIDVKFENIEDGYDHLCKTRVFVDGELVATSSEELQSKPNTLTVNIPRGEHTVKVVNYALYEGNWEEHTIENNYSVDCLHEFTEKFRKKKYKLNIVFDLDDVTKTEFK